MGSDHKRRFGVRFRLILVSLLLICTPLLVVWSMGIYEAIYRRTTERQVRRSGQALLKELSRRGKPGRRSLMWMHAFAREHHLMVRVLNRRGQVLRHTDPKHADRWSGVNDWFRRAGNFFFGPSGPPDLLAYEATLPPEGRRPEVTRALAGQPAQLWRESRDTRLVVHYRALPMPGEGGALYITRLSRRGIRGLYDLRYQVLKLTLVLAAVALALGAWSGWRVVNPLIRMQRAIHAYLRNPGQGLSAMDGLAVKRRDEIGDLSRDLGHLARRLHGRLEQTASDAGDLAHDLKNPIATVTASAELLDGDAPLDADRRQRLARSLEQASTHMSRSVEGMLELARLEQSMGRVERDPVDLPDLLQRVVSTYVDSPSTSSAIELQVEAEGSMRVLGIEQRLEQLFCNLLDNALLFCRSRVVVRLDREGEGQTRVEVRDDGPGVSPGHRGRIFDRFFTARQEGEKPGTGLGLAMARTIARAHGGELRLVETNGPGACFELTLPTPV